MTKSDTSLPNNKHPEEPINQLVALLEAFEAQNQLTGSEAATLWRAGRQVIWEMVYLSADRHPTFSFDRLADETLAQFSVEEVKRGREEPTKWEVGTLQNAVTQHDATPGH